MAPLVVQPLLIPFYFIFEVNGIGLLSETCLIICSDNCQSRFLHLGCGILMFPCLLTLIKDAFICLFEINSVAMKFLKFLYDN